MNRSYSVLYLHSKLFFIEIKSLLKNNAFILKLFLKEFSHLLLELLEKSKLLQSVLFKQNLAQPITSGIL
jgi:hypothetical protein